MWRKMCVGIPVNCLLFLPDFNESQILSTVFRKIFRYQISWKSVKWGPSCYRRTHMTKLIVALRNFANAPKKGRKCGRAHSMKECQGNTGTFHSFLTSVLKVSGQHHAPGHFTPGKEPRYPLNRRLGGPRSSSGHSREGISCSCRDTNSGPSCS